MKPVERAARETPSRKAANVRRASKLKTDARVSALERSFNDVEAARNRAAAIRADVLNRLPDLLVEFEKQATANGIQVHWAKDADEACRLIGDLLPRQDRPLVVKGKSMATEEIHLNAYLEASGAEVVETDLGEFVVQIDGDTPSHIVTPIIHRDRHEVSASFAREKLGPTTTVPEELALQARVHLREKFRHADVGISGVNFAIAETGRLVIVENEGNNRLSTTVSKVHIAVMGIEKLLPREADLPLFLRLLAGSATGQHLTVYTHLISGPRRDPEVDGPEEVHVILLDNGRSQVRNGPIKEILGCIRCGACLNVCPVFREVSGHGYGHVYGGPLGAVLAPALEGHEKWGHLAFASSLCGACEAVCPVKIPIPDLLVRLRHAQGGAPFWKAYAEAARTPQRWRAGLTLLPMVGGIPTGWSEFHAPPEREGRDFRSWWKKR
jgi:L-lactate dehydrogenase complex protein LldF